MQIAVSFCDTSKPTNRVIEPPPMLQTAGRQRPDRSTIGKSDRRRDYPMSTHAGPGQRPIGANFSVGDAAWGMIHSEDAKRSHADVALG
jgi:hypothetical protein